MDSATQQTRGNSDRVLTARFFAAAALLGCAYVLIRAPSVVSMLAEEPWVAAHLARGHGYLSPFDPSASAPPTALCPPVYPLIVAAVYRLLGVETSLAVTVVMLLNAVFFGALVAGMYQIGRRLFSMPVGIVAGFIVLLHPLFVLRLAFCWDTYLSLALFAWLIVAALHLSRDRPGPAAVAGLGAGLGALVLTSCSYLLACPIIVLVALRRWPGRRRWISVAPALLAFVLVLSPWTIRNYRAFGRVIPLRTCPEFEVWVGNLPGASGWVNNKDIPAASHAERELILTMGEPAYGRYCRRRFQENYRRAPVAFWTRTLRRGAYVFIGDPTGAGITQTSLGSVANLGRRTLDITSLALIVLGLAAALRAGFRVWWVPVLALASVAPALFCQMCYRYSMPARYLMLVFVAYLLVEAGRRVRGRFGRSSVA